MAMPMKAPFALVDMEGGKPQHPSCDKQQQF